MPEGHDQFDDPKSMFYPARLVMLPETVLQNQKEDDDMVEVYGVMG